MNFGQRLITILLTSVCLILMISPKKVTVKLYKTDQETWGKNFSYALETEGVKPTRILPWDKPIIREKFFFSSFKPIRKDVTLSFDTSNDVNILHVCTKANGCYCPTTLEKEGNAQAGKSIECKQLNLNNHPIDLVIGIDKKGMPKSMTKGEVEKLINDSKPPKLYPVDVRKTSHNKTLWNIKAIKSDNGEPDRDVVYGEINIKQDTLGVFDTKLKVPIDREVFIMVNDKTPQKFPKIAANTVLYIGPDEIVTISGKTAADIAAEDAQKKAQEAQEAEEKAEREREEIRKREQEKRDKQVARLKKVVELREKPLKRAKSTQWTQDDMEKALAILADDYHNRGRAEDENRVRPAIKNATARNNLTQEDKELAKKLWIKYLEEQLEKAETELKEAEAQAAASIEIHFPEKSGAGAKKLGHYVVKPQKKEASP